MNKTILYVIGVIVLVVIAAGSGFFAGNAYAQSQSQAVVANFQQQRGTANAGGGQNGQGAQAAAGPCGFRQFGGNGGTGGGADSGTPTTPTTRQGGSGNGGTGGGQGGQFAQLGRCVAAGQVKSVDGNTVQISTATSVVTVKVDDKTQISKTDSGTISDLTPGTRVVVFSQQTGDSPTASGIQIQRAAGQ
jgi:hypothetical protein